MLPDCLDDLNAVAGTCDADPLAIVVLCVGCFDMLHAGHVHLLREARWEASRLPEFNSTHLSKIRLVVALNTDESVRKLKGGGRPVYPLEQRAFMLRSIRYVDYVVPFDGNPVLPIHGLRPRLYVKGDDRQIDQLPERVVLEHYGSRILIVPRLPGVSTTETLKQVR